MADAMLVSCVNADLNLTICVLNESNEEKALESGVDDIKEFSSKSLEHKKRLVREDGLLEGFFRVTCTTNAPTRKKEIVILLELSRGDDDEIRKGMFECKDMMDLLVSLMGSLSMEMRTQSTNAIYNISKCDEVKKGLFKFEGLMGATVTSLDREGDEFVKERDKAFLSIRSLARGDAYVKAGLFYYPGLRKKLTKYVQSVEDKERPKGLKCLEKVMDLIKQPSSPAQEISPAPTVPTRAISVSEVSSIRSSLSALETIPQTLSSLQSTVESVYCVPPNKSFKLVPVTPRNASSSISSKRKNDDVGGGGGKKKKDLQKSRVFSESDTDNDMV